MPPDKPDNRDQNPEVTRTTADAARKRVEARKPEQMQEHYRDDLTVTDDVPCADCEED